MSNLHLLLQQQMDEILSHPFVLSSLACLFLAWLITKLVNKSDLNFPPSPNKLPVIGNLHQLGLFPHKNLQSLAKKYGPLMLLHFGSVPTLIVSSAEAATEIMKTHDLNFVNKPESSVNKRLLYDYKGISVAPYGEYWRQLKSIVVLQLLNNKRVNSFRSVRKEETALLMEKIQEASISSSPVDLSEMLTKLTSDVICRSAFGRKYSVGEEGKKFLKLLKEFVELLGNISIGSFIPWLSWINRINGFDTRVDVVAKEMDDFLEGVIQEQLAKGKGLDGNGENFVDILLGIYKDKTSDVSIDRDSIKAILLDVFAGGTDTTFTVLGWAMAELIRDPILMKNLQNEVRTILKGKQDITENDLEQMHYLKAVIKETLRRHTPIPILIPRIASKDIKIQGYDVLAGTMVMTNAWAIGMDPAYWAEPEKFRPDRFLNSSIDYKGLDFEFLPFGAGRRPFGAGRRGCPGISFAMATDEFVIASLMNRFDWQLPNGALGKDLDMTDKPGLAIHRAAPLLAVATTV